MLNNRDSAVEISRQSESRIAAKNRDNRGQESEASIGVRPSSQSALQISLLVVSNLVETKKLRAKTLRKSLGLPGVVCDGIIVVWYLYELHDTNLFLLCTNTYESTKPLDGLLAILGMWKLGWPLATVIENLTRHTVSIIHEKKSTIQKLTGGISWLKLIQINDRMHKSYQVAINNVLWRSSRWATSSR